MEVFVILLSHDTPPELAELPPSDTDCLERFGESIPSAEPRFHRCLNMGYFVIISNRMNQLFDGLPGVG